MHVIYTHTHTLSELDTSHLPLPYYLLSSTGPMYIQTVYTNSQGTSEGFFWNNVLIEFYSKKCHIHDLLWW